MIYSFYIKFMTVRTIFITACLIMLAKMSKGDCVIDDDIVPNEEYVAQVRDPAGDSSILFCRQTCIRDPTCVGRAYVAGQCFHLLGCTDTSTQASTGERFGRVATCTGCSEWTILNGYFPSDPPTVYNGVTLEQCMNECELAGCVAFATNGADPNNVNCFIITGCGDDENMFSANDEWNFYRKCGTCPEPVVCGHTSASCCGGTTAGETTQAPTTQAPTTEAPTTIAPTTIAPTTIAPTTKALTTISQTTIAPTTEAPSTIAPTTEAPTTEAPTTIAPTTEAPTTIALTTEAPTTEAPTTIVHTTESPTTIGPTTKAPTTEASTTIAPITESSVTIPPTPKAPTTEPPTTIAPTTEAPSTIAQTTAAETTVSPTHNDLTTIAPTTIAPTAIASTANAPNTMAPTAIPVTTVASTNAVITTAVLNTLQPITEQSTAIQPTSINSTQFQTTISVPTTSPTKTAKITKTTTRTKTTNKSTTTTTTKSTTTTTITTSSTPTEYPLNAVLATTTSSYEGTNFQTQSNTDNSLVACSSISLLFVVFIAFSYRILANRWNASNAMNTFAPNVQINQLLRFGPDVSQEVSNQQLRFGPDDIPTSYRPRPIYERHPRWNRKYMRPRYRHPIFYPLRLPIIRLRRGINRKQVVPSAFPLDRIQVLPLRTNFRTNTQHLYQPYYTPQYGY